MLVGLVKQNILLPGVLHFKQAWGKTKCVSAFSFKYQSPSRMWKHHIFPFLPMSPSKRLYLLAWPWYWTTFSSCSASHAIESNARKVPLWLSFLISYITCLSEHPGSDQMSTLKNTMNVTFPVREKPPLQPWLKSLKSNNYYTYYRKMHLIFV